MAGAPFQGGSFGHYAFDEIDKVIKGDAGSYALTGTAATLKHSWKLAAEAAPTSDGGPFLIDGEDDGLGIDFAYDTEVSIQMSVRDTATLANNGNFDPASKLTYTSPSVKLTRRSNGVYALTNGSTELPYEWDAAGDAIGLRLEEQRTNLVVRSQEFTNASWTAQSNIAITADQTTAPDDTTTADKIAATLTTSSNVALFQARTLSSGATYTLSMFAKAGTQGTYVSLFLYSNASAKGTHVIYNLNTGAVAGNWAESSGALTLVGSSIEDAGRGWYRCIATITCDANTAFEAGTSVPNNTSTHAQTSGDNHYIWGFQVELGSFATSYIATTNATVTRAADALNLATSSFNHDATEGTLYVKFRPINVAAIRYAVVMDDGTANELIAVGSTAAGAGGFTVTDGGAAQTAPLTNGTVTAGADNKVAVSWAASDFAISTNGTAASTDTSGTLPTVTSLRLSSSANPLNGHLMHVVHLARAMTDGELATRST